MQDEGSSRRFVGWLLDDKDRSALLARFPPVYPDVVADHITLRNGADEDTPVPTARRADVLGRMDDGDGVEALVVSIEGSSTGPDGGTFHMTWSLDRARGRRAVHSNDAIARLGWRALPQPIPISITPEAHDKSH